VIETAHLVVVAGKILAGLFRIYQIGRHYNIIVAVNHGVFTYLPATMSIGRSKPEEEGLRGA
jgi:hypothetical protein